MITTEIREKITKIKEKTGQTIFTVAAIICVIAVAAIFVFMFIKSLPAFNKIGVFDFIFGDNWAPTDWINSKTQRSPDLTVYSK